MSDRFYRGVKLADDARLTRQLKSGLDTLIEKMEREGHEILSEYKNSHVKVLIDFKCEHEPQWMTTSAYKMGQGCFDCTIKQTIKVRSEEAKEMFADHCFYNGHEWVDGEYVNQNTKVLIDFKCGHKPHWIKPSKYRIGQGCPLCKESKGEKVIADFLNENEIAHIREYVFYDLPNKRYDFFLTDYNLIVEIHGIQHYVQNKKWTGRTLEDEQNNDTMKKEHCLKSGVHYMEVDYRECKPELALQRFIRQFEEFKEVI